MNKQRFSPVTFATILAALLLLQACTRPQKHVPSTDEKSAFVDEVRLPATPVKQQGKSELCWIYAMLATIETEHLVRGDSVNLSPTYLLRCLLDEQAPQLYFDRNHSPRSLRGMATMTLDLLSRHGVHPYDYYHGHEHPNTHVLARRLAQLAHASAAQRTGLKAYQDKVGQLLDDELGFMPRYVHMLGAEYTSLEFGHSVCMDDEYEALTSFTHHPWGERFALEVPDNQWGDEFLNVPIDTLMARIDRSLQQGHPVCWEGDISETGFSFAEGVADLALEVPNDGSKQHVQQLRQQHFERLQTTDDHCMALVGLAHDRQGRRFYLAKNSWGRHNRYGGYMYLSADYVRLKTLCIVVKR